MTWLLLIGVAGADAEIDVDAVWRYHHARLHESLRSADWQAAKQALAQLRRCDPQAYEDQAYWLSEALIAQRERRWGSLYRLTADRVEGGGWTALARAQALERMGRPKAALKASFTANVRFTQDQRHQLYALRARCAQALGDVTGAIKHWRKLARAGVQTLHRAEANQALATLFYQTGQLRKARGLAEWLQAKRPGSDAALFSVDLQERHETATYLDRRSVWKRFSEVCYRNRDFERANRYFRKVLAANADRDAERARFFLMRTHNKEARPKDAIRDYERQRTQFERGAFAGPAAFQYARSLFMEGRDGATIAFVNDYWSRADASPKWRWECLRLLILALRRQESYDAFQELERRLTAEGAPNWLRGFYHRNGVAWALKARKPDEALFHLERYRLQRLKWHERQEADLWEGMILWALNSREQAIAAWLRVVGKDPNHYFGLTAREFLRAGAPETGLWRARWFAARKQLNALPLEELRELYYLAPNAEARGQVAAALSAYMPDDAWLAGTPAIAGQQAARRYLSIGRYDLAAGKLQKRGMDARAYHFHKATWRMHHGDLHASIRHAEILAKNYPRWTPYELMPRQLQRLAFPKGFARIIQEKATGNGVDPYLLLAIIREESRFNAQAKSWASARGLMQFIPDTAREIAEEVDEIDDFSLPMLYEPETSIALGARYLEKLMETFGGVSLYTVAAYNAGESAVDRWRAFSQAHDPVQFVWDVTYDETKFYCQKVLRAYHHYARVYGNGDDPGVIEAPSLSP